MEKKLIKRFVRMYLGSQVFLVALWSYTIPNGPDVGSELIQAPTLGLQKERRGPWIPMPDVDQDGMTGVISSLTATSTS